MVLLRWRERTPSAVTLHASIWVKNGETWRLRFEQRTPIACPLRHARTPAIPSQSSTNRSPLGPLGPPTDPTVCA